MSREILDAMKALAVEKGIAPDRLIHALEDALLSAYKKQPGAAKYARVEMDPDTGDYRVIELIVPERLEAHLIVETIDEGTYIDPETGELVEPQDPEIDPAKFEEYRDQIDERDVTPDDFGRIAAQTAKQVILQRIREAERDMMFEEYRDRVGELITGIVQQSDSRYTLVQLRERVEALLPKSEQVDGERYDHSQRIKAVIKEVSPSTKGPSIIVSRRDPELIKKLFELEVPEIADGLVEIANVAREPGYRSKIAVVSYADGVDPVGACVGPARLARAHGRLRAARREDRHHPLQRRARPLRGQGALARARARGARRRRGPPGHRRGPRRPALAGHRARGPERAPGRAADRLAHRHQVRDRVRHRGARAAATRRRRPAGAARRSWATAAAAPTRRCRARASAASTATRRSRAPAPSTSPASRRRRAWPRTARSRRPSPRRRSPQARASADANDGLVEEAWPRRPWRTGSRPRRSRATAPTRSSRPPRPPSPRPSPPMSLPSRRARPRRGDGGGARLIAAARHIPQRRCVACGRRAPKAALRRLAVRGERVVADPGASLPGRGAYVCDAACAQTAIERRAFAPGLPPGRVR